MTTKNLLKVISVFIIGIVGGIFADQILWPYFVERPLFYKYNLEQPPIYITERKEIIIQENTALVEAIEKVEKSIVGVRTETKAGKILEGSGLILTSDGLMITLASLVPYGSNFKFYWQGKPLGFEILKRDLKENLALVKLRGKDLPTLGFANSAPKLGERVFLVGIVFDKRTPKKIVNEGIVKSFDLDFIKTNIFENYLLAGSPLFNIEGKILGINTIDKQGKVITIPISKIRTFADL